MKWGVEAFILILPLALISILYEYSRSLAYKIDLAIDYNAPLLLEKYLFGAPLAVYFQSFSWEPLNVFFSVIYSLHPLYFILLLLFILVLDRTVYKHALISVTVASTVAIAFYILWPVAPPWIAVPGITRMPNYLFRVIGRSTSIDPNAYAAMPSMHVAYSYFFAYYSIIVSGERRGWKWLVWGGRLMALLMPITVIYTGNHYLLDVFMGLLIAMLSLEAANIVYRRLQPSWIVFMRQS